MKILRIVTSQRARSSEGRRSHLRGCYDAGGWGLILLAFRSWLGQTPEELVIIYTPDYFPKDMT